MAVALALSTFAVMCICSPTQSMGLPRWTMLSALAKTALAYAALSFARCCGGFEAAEPAENSRASSNYPE